MISPSRRLNLGSLLLLSCSVFFFFSNAAKAEVGQDFDNDSLRQAVQLWLDDPQEALAEYGPMEDWSTWQVTDMSQLFQGAINFTANLLEWDVSSVTDMNHMFAGCNKFDSKVTAWDVSQVTSMASMFHKASSFEGLGVAHWDTSSVRTMEQMFLGASSFRGKISNWDVSRVTTMYAMFFQATSFDQPVNDWDMSRVQSTNSMFEHASSFSQQICWNQVHPSAKFFQAFCGTAGAAFDASSGSCRARMHPSITAYSQACNPGDALEEVVQNSVINRPPPVLESISTNSRSNNNKALDEHQTVEIEAEESDNQNDPVMMASAGEAVGRDATRGMMVMAVMSTFMLMQYF